MFMVEKEFLLLLCDYSIKCGVSSDFDFLEEKIKIFPFLPDYFVKQTIESIFPLFYPVTYLCSSLKRETTLRSFNRGNFLQGFMKVIDKLRIQNGGGGQCRHEQKQCFWRNKEGSITKDKIKVQVETIVDQLGRTWCHIEELLVTGKQRSYHWQTVRGGKTLAFPLLPLFSLPTPPPYT